MGEKEARVEIRAPGVKTRQDVLFEVHLGLSRQAAHPDTFAR
jgi:hypothetical protein